VDEGHEDCKEGDQKRKAAGHRHGVAIGFCDGNVSLDRTSFSLPHKRSGHVAKITKMRNEANYKNTK